MDDLNLKSIGENIQKYRMNKNLTQEDMATLLEMSKRQIGEIETGNSFSTIDVLSQISDLLEIPMDVLFKDCSKEFLVYAIDDYLNLIDGQKASSILTELLDMMGTMKS